MIISKKEEEDLIQQTREDSSLMSKLTPRELYIFEEYCMKGGITLNALAVDVSREFGVDVTGERVRQLKGRAVGKIKHTVYLRGRKAREIKVAVDAEREACAQVVEQAGIDGYGTLAAAVRIRARKEK